MANSFLKALKSRLLIPLLLSLCSWTALAGTYHTLPSDGREWRFSPTHKTVSIGDIHGDFDALVTILLDRSLITPDGHWKGGDTQLVMIGDLIDRGSDSRLVLDFMMRLQEEAKGKIHVLPGNHEALVAAETYDYVSAEDLKSYEDLIPEKLWDRKTPVTAELQQQGVRQAFSGNSKYAKWLREQNSMITIGDTLYVHAGVGEWAQQADPASVNSTVRAWLAYLQGVGPQPDAKTAWVLGESVKSEEIVRGEGPLWTRVFSPEGHPPELPVLKDLGELLKKLGVKRVVVGHCPSFDSKIHLSHHTYGHQVVRIDTGISRAYDGNLSALEIEGDVLTPYLMDRPLGPVPLRAIELERALKSRQPHGLGIRCLAKLGLRFHSNR